MQNTWDKNNSIASLINPPDSRSASNSSSPLLLQSTAPSSSSTPHPPFSSLTSPPQNPKTLDLTNRPTAAAMRSASVSSTGTNTSFGRSRSRRSDYVFNPVYAEGTSSSASPSVEHTQSAPHPQPHYSSMGSKNTPPSPGLTNPYFASGTPVGSGNGITQLAPMQHQQPQPHGYQQQQYHHQLRQQHPHSEPPSPTTGSFPNTPVKSRHQQQGSVSGNSTPAHGNHDSSVPYNSIFGGGGGAGGYSNYPTNSSQNRLVNAPSYSQGLQQQQHPSRPSSENSNASHQSQHAIHSNVELAPISTITSGLSGGVQGGGNAGGLQQYHQQQLQQHQHQQLAAQGNTGSTFWAGPSAQVQATGSAPGNGGSNFGYATANWVGSRPGTAASTISVASSYASGSGSTPGESLQTAPTNAISTRAQHPDAGGGGSAGGSSSSHPTQGHQQGQQQQQQQPYTGIAQGQQQTEVGSPAALLMDDPHIYENGRRYSRIADCLFPDDEKEQDRLDMSHHIFTMLMQGNLHMSPVVDEPERILDVGTGTGIWVLDMAQKYPMATAIGIDISPMQPKRNIPPNVHFMMHDAELPWPWPIPSTLNSQQSSPDSSPSPSEGDYSHTFDLIHTRALVGSLENWSRFFDQAFTHTRPGTGYLEMQEYCTEFHSPDGSLSPHSAISQWQSLFNRAAELSGKPPGSVVAKTLKAQMERVGYVNITERELMLPFGIWSPDREMKRLGSYAVLNMLDGVEGYTLKLFTKYLGWSLEQCTNLIQDVRREFKNLKGIKMYSTIHIVYGRRPDDLEFTVERPVYRRAGELRGYRNSRQAGSRAGSAGGLY